MQGGRGGLGGVNPEEVDWADEELGAKKAVCLQRLTETEVPDRTGTYSALPTFPGA